MGLRRSHLCLVLFVLGIPVVGSPALSDGTDTEWLTREALAKYQAGEVEEAIADLEILRDEGQATPRILAALATFYLEIGLHQDADEILTPLADDATANPAVLYNAGRAALGVGDDERGESYLRRSVEIQRTSPAGRLLGLRLGARGRPDLAYPLLRPWALANPEDSEGRLAAAAAAVQLQRTQEADDLLVGADESAPRVRLLRAEIALQRRDPTAALEHLRPFAAEPPPPEMAADVLHLMASAQLELGRSPVVVDLLAEPAVGNPRLSLALAQAQYQSGDVESALATLEPFLGPVVLEADVDEIPQGAQRDLAASMTFERGRMLVATGQATEGLPLLERSAALDPWRRETWQELARAHSATGDSAAAAQALERFQQLAEARQQAEIPGLRGQRRQDDTVGRRLSEALEWAARGELDQGLSVVRQEISLSPADPRPRLLEIRLLLSAGRTPEARGAADAAVEKFPEHVDALHFRAVTAMAGNDAEAAEADLRRVLELDSGHVPARNDLALVLMSRGELESAKTLLEGVLVSHPDDPVARRRLDQIAAALAQSADGSGSR